VVVLPRCQRELAAEPPLTVLQKFLASRAVASCVAGAFSCSSFFTMHMSLQLGDDNRGELFQITRRWIGFDYTTKARVYDLGRTSLHPRYPYRRF